MRNDGGIGAKMSVTLVADGDGTLYGAPTDVDPELDTSPARDPLIAWLKPGNKLLLVTGGDYPLVMKRFVRHIPLELHRHVTVSANGGATLYRPASTGELVEDREYTTQCIIPDQTVPRVIEVGTVIIGEFMRRVKTDPITREDLLTNIGGRWKFLVPIADEYVHIPGRLISMDSQLVPRIEVRKVDGAVLQIGIVGIPSGFSREYIARFGDQGLLTFAPISLTIEVTRTGVNKTRPLNYLAIDPGKSIAVGDSPHENDAPLTRYEVRGFKMPFVSVCGRPEKVPESCRELHIGRNMEGTADLLKLITPDPIASITSIRSMVTLLR